MTFVIFHLRGVRDGGLCEGRDVCRHNTIVIKGRFGVTGDGYGSRRGTVLRRQRGLCSKTGGVFEGGNFWFRQETRLASLIQNICA